MAKTDRPRRAPQGKYPRTGYSSPIDAALEVIGGKYKVAILYHLRASVVRFGELRRLMPLATPRMLTKQLRELERDGMIRRKVFRQVPPRVDYFLTPGGEAWCRSSRRSVSGVSGGSDVPPAERFPRQRVWTRSLAAGLRAGEGTRPVLRVPEGTRSAP